MGINRRDRNREHWFVMNTYTRSNDRVETLLGNARDVAYFIPKQYAVRTFNGASRRVLVPLIPHMFFMRGSYEYVDSFQKDTSLIGFATATYEGRRTIIQVPDHQMDNFIKVVSHYEDDLTYYRPEEITLKPGQYIKIIGGRYNGIKGELLSQRGKRGKRLVARIPRIMAVATTVIEPEYIQLITEEEYLQDCAI